jgi:signal transduction histidine kinase
MIVVIRAGRFGLESTGQTGTFRKIWRHGMAWTSSATPRGHARPFSWCEDLAGALARRRLPHGTHLGRVAVVIHAVAMASLLQPHPMHAMLLLSGATLVMLVWQLKPAQAAAPVAARPDATGAEPPLPMFSEQVVPPAAGRAQDIAFDDMLAHLSHELRTPLNAVIGFADLMDAETFGPVGHPRYREYLAHIRSSGAHLLASAETTLTIAELLSGSRAAPARSAVRLADVARESWNGDSVCALEGLEVLSDRATLVRALTGLTGGAEPHFSATRLDEAIVLTLELDDVAEPSSKVSLRVAAARLLLQSVGASLTERTFANGRRMAEITLERAAQTDMFGWQPRQPWQPALGA